MNLAGNMLRRTGDTTTCGLQTSPAGPFLLFGLLLLLRVSCLALVFGLHVRPLDHMESCRARSAMMPCLMASTMQRNNLAGLGGTQGTVCQGTRVAL